MNVDYNRLSDQDLEDIIHGLTTVRSTIIDTLETLPDTKYLEKINVLFRIVHSFKAFISCFDFTTEITGVVEKTEDVLSFLRSNDCVIGHDVRNWLGLVSYQFSIWIDEFHLALDDFVPEMRFNPPSFYTPDLDNPPMVKVSGYKINKIVTHRILILLNDPYKMGMLEKILDSSFTLINASDNVEKITDIIKTSPEQKILISDIKLRDGTLIDLINHKHLENTDLIVLSKLDPSHIDKVKNILKTKHVYNIENTDLRELKKAILSIALPENDMVYIPFVSTKISLADLTKSVKSMSEIVEKIKEACFDDNIHFNKLAEIIEQDMVITGKILKQINSAYYGIRQHVSSVSRAITLMGKQNLYAITIHGIADEMLIETDLSMYGIGYDDIFEINKMRTKFLKSLCRELKIGHVEFEIMSTVSLLTGLGTVMAAKAMTYNLQNEKFANIRKTDSLYVIEKKMLGYTSYQIASKIFYKWNLPRHFVHIADKMPCLHIDKNKSPNEFHAFILTIVHEIIRMDDIYKIDTKVLDMAKSSGIQPTTILVAFHDAFGEDMPISGIFTDLMGLKH